MPTRAHDRFFEEQRERDRRYGLEHDEYAEFVHELELADRIADPGIGTGEPAQPVPVGDGADVDAASGLRPGARKASGLELRSQRANTRAPPFGDMTGPGLGSLPPGQVLLHRIHAGSEPPRHC